MTVSVSGPWYRRRPVLEIPLKSLWVVHRYPRRLPIKSAPMGMGMIHRGPLKDVKNWFQAKSKFRIQFIAQQLEFFF